MCASILAFEKAGLQARRISTPEIPALAAEVILWHGRLAHAANLSSVSARRTIFVPSKVLNLSF
jgi:hypothetical protein